MQMLIVCFLAFLLALAAFLVGWFNGEHRTDLSCPHNTWFWLRGFFLLSNLDVYNDASEISMYYQINHLLEHLWVTSRFSFFLVEEHSQ